MDWAAAEYDKHILIKYMHHDITYEESLKELIFNGVEKGQ